MNVIELVLDLVSLPPTLLFILKWLVGLVLIDRLLEKLTKNKLSLEKIVKVVLVEVRNSLRLPPNLQPWSFNNRKIKKLLSYTLCCSMAYMCIVFFTLLIIYLLMFILRKNAITFDKMLFVSIIILLYGWASRFAYIEMRVAFKNAKSI
ncbi:hypothetical protein RMB03_01125 [Acinetobacter sp. V91_7]|uniref:hypothetical protein n=1 Tax=unclassified Acinetobacter TaxID=196816 RepID=UPI00287BD751|nr:MULTISPECIES: hypothetical protein [unclassified Acinetobacter]MDS7932168.1 hypothetical protein [Acinetobacter sp. V91_4B]MDS7961566.1 hypothetical protein [Acinetobacter sp. V91_7]MDS8028016.1 hypothetical protein [Acinetobacter sp. V91_13]